MNSIIIKVGLISFLNDISSEMLIPITPIFLTSVLGASMSSIGWIEGFAELLASVLKLSFGQLSDRMGRRKPFVWIGYFLSVLSKGAIGLAQTWWGVFFARAIEKVGKGMRTAPRDALIAESVPKEQLGLAFGVHKGMDTLGAVVGPLVALLLLSLWGTEHLRSFYSLAMIPGFFAVCTALFLPEKKKEIKVDSKNTIEDQLIPRAYFKYLFAWGIYCLGNSSDAFLLLKAKAMGHSLNETILFYCFFNFVYALSSPFLGKLSDRVGKARMLKVSLLVFAFVYFGFFKGWSLWWMFGIYGIFMGMSEGVGKARVAEYAKGATAQGWFGMVTGVCAFAASVFAGLLWDHGGATLPFLFGGICSLLSLIVFVIFKC